MNHQLRFAPLVRVSTDNQAKKGESLNTQKKQILDYVKILDGTIPDFCWQYSGQEHATPNQERVKLDKLLADSKKNLFDAVIVCDASRWSRDNGKNDEGLKHLRTNGIRFFVGIKEYDLFEPQDFMILSMEAVFNSFHAAEQAKKSLLNRIEKAKQNIPTSGKIPYGRTFEKEWGIDPDKQIIIENAAEMYLKGVSARVISSTLNMNWPNLLKILKYRSGEHWEIRFRKKEFGIDKTVALKIPELLPEETIEAIRQRAEANKTYSHGKIKHEYLLSRMIFCQHCGLALSGQTNHSGKRYYRHSKRDKDQECVTYVPADDIERAVFIHLFKMFGDVSNLEKAIERAIPDPKKVERIEEQKQLLEKQQKEIHLGKKRLLEQVKKGNLTDEEIKNDMQNIRNQDQEITTEIETINSQLQSIPSKIRRKKSAQLMKKVIGESYKFTFRIPDMSIGDKKMLFQTAFAGKGIDGRRLGVYLREWIQKDKRRIYYAIKGVLGDEESYLPMTFEEYTSIFGIGDEALVDGKAREEFEQIKLNISSQCHAYYRVGFHK
jgi:site-specific DNA recombinase